MKSPYTALGRRAFWRTGVLADHPLEIRDLYRKKFAISHQDRIATAGSCFAQHIAGRLRGAGYCVLDAEPAPAGLDIATANAFGFGLYSARYGNIYTIRQMLQLVQECEGQRCPAEVVWDKDGRYYDALRPSVEPRGLSSRDAVLRHRRQHLDRLRDVLENVDLFVFTLGLTETWEHGVDGTVYPTAPGTIAGSYDTWKYKFKNFTFNEIMRDFIELRQTLKARRDNIRFMLTVSPVPLTATAGPEHVLAASVYSKSVLRAVAGELAASYADIDYFPSYEIITSVPSRGFLYENNLRSVSQSGVDLVMRSFFEQHGSGASEGGSTPEMVAGHARSSIADLAAITAAQRTVCDDELLEAFAS